MIRVFTNIGTTLLFKQEGIKASSYNGVLTLYAYKPEEIQERNWKFQNVKRIVYHHYDIAQFAA